MTPNSKIKRRQYGKYITGMLSVADLVIVNVLFALVLTLCPLHIDTMTHRMLWVLVNVSYLPSMFWMSRRSHQQRVVLMDYVAKGAFFVVGLHALFFLSLIAFLGIDDIPSRFYLEFYGLMAIAIPLWWIVSRRLLKLIRRRGYNFIRVVIVGAGPTAVRLLEELNSDDGFGYKVLGFVADDVPPAFGGKVLGDIAELDRIVKEKQVDQIFYTLAASDEGTLSSVVKIADDNVKQFYYVPPISRLVSRSFECFNIGVVPVLSIRRNPLNSLLNRMIKRGFDIAFSSIVLLFSPLWFLPIAIGVKLTSKGPILFKQDRTGYKGRTFKCLKFRTMCVNDKADTQQAVQSDPRMTKFGQWLRRTSLDEMPQFINVLLGDMSVVGPRPHMLKHTEDYAKVIDLYMVRHTIQPGITGWAQVNGYRGITDELWKMERRVECDVWYVENWSFLLDLKIVVRTVINALSHEDNAF